MKEYFTGKETVVSSPKKKQTTVEEMQLNNTYGTAATNNAKNDGKDEQQVEK